MVGDDWLRGDRRRIRAASCPPLPRIREAKPRSFPGEEPSRILCDTAQAPNPEYARQDGQIRVRSRTLMNSPG